MTRGITTVMSRTQPTETISFPVLTYSDALPRTDLQTLDAAAQRQEAIAGQWNFHQPSPGDGWIRRPPPAQVKGATFDFRITAPPDEVIQPVGRTPAEQHMIGIALGSPRLLKQDEALPPPRFDTSVFAQGQCECGLSHKTSKWKKIGGLFKAKNALTSHQDGMRDGEPKPEHEYRMYEKPRKTKERKNSTEESPNLEVDPTQARVNPNQQRSRKFSLSCTKAPKEQPQPSPSVQGPLLSVDIPDIQMERYSVMFGNVVSKNQRPPLLARRAKTLDNLQVPNSNAFLKAPVARPMPQRRATSPGRSGSALFPTSQPSKAARILGTQNFSRGPCPLMRSNTLPVESPSKMPAQHSRHGSNKNSLSSFESPSIPKPFSAASSTGSYDKPLPAIRPEPQPSHLQKSVQPPKNIQSPQTIRQQQSAKSQKTLSTKQDAHPRPLIQPRKDSLPLVAARAQTQVVSPQKTSTKSRIDDWLDQQKPEHTMRPSLRVQTEDRPEPPAKDILSSKPLSPPSTLNPTQEKIDRIMSPLSASTGPRSGISPSDSTRMPFVDAAEPLESTEEEPEPEEIPRAIPQVEVSIARSISVSRAKRQLLVPVGGRIEQDPEERFGQRRALTPQITDAHRGHRPGVSQQLRIECL